MHTRRSTTPLPALLWAALSAACGGGDSATEPEPEPQTTTLQIHVDYVEVIEDCDGIEGDGDFEFQILVGPGPVETVYRGSVSLPPGGTREIDERRSYTYAVDTTAEVMVQFTAWEWDRDILGNVYADSRLNAEYGSVSHVLTNGTWSRTGTRGIALGSAGCEVVLYWVASPR